MVHAAVRSRRGWAAIWITTGIAGLITLTGGAASAQPKPAAPKAPATAKPPPPSKAPAATAAAASEILGTVLALQGEELVLDLGAASGATDGATVEIWRPIKLKHPVTG